MKNIQSPFVAPSYPGDHCLIKQIKQLTENTSTQVSAFLAKWFSSESLESCYNCVKTHCILYIQ